MKFSSACARKFWVSYQEIQQTAAALAQLDVLASFAETARLHNYCRPQVADEGILQIRDGRHPVLEQQLVEERFVPNDTELAIADCRLPIENSAPVQNKPAIGNRNPQSPDRAHHRAEHGGQIHLHPAGRAARAARAHRQFRAGGRRRGLIWWTAFSRASARAMICRAGNPRSWSK